MASEELASQFPFISAFAEETDLAEYQENALGIFALGLYLRLEDAHEFAASALTAGPDDKKIDICYLDENDGRVIVGQCYVAEEWGAEAAPANKAGDLTTGVGWLLSASEHLIPPHLVTKAREVRGAIQGGAISRFELVFVHNCMESVNVKRELKAAADTARDILIGICGQAAPVVSCREFGLNEIQDLYESRESEILVDEVIEVPHAAYVEEHGPDWRAILTSVPASWITTLYQQHGNRLFSANYRDYLGYTRRSTNINSQITQTATQEPGNFWVYNNGITALTHRLALGDPTTARGLSIINGAQTTGALAEAPGEPTQEARVLIRIVECEAPELVDKIIRYNNTQNEIKPADRRSNDPTQRRLHADFQAYGILYIHRRTAARTPRSAVTAAAIAPALCAFHGEPQVSYRNAKDIFNDEETYQRVFPPQLRAEHVFLVRALSLALDDLKSGLKGKVALEAATKNEASQFEVLKYSASKHFLFFMCGRVAEQIMARRVSDLHEWQANRDQVAPASTSLVYAWQEALQAMLPLLAQAVSKQPGDPFYDVPRSMPLSAKVALEMEAILTSLQTPLSSQFAPLRDRTSL